MHMIYLYLFIYHYLYSFHTVRLSSRKCAVKLNLSLREIRIAGIERETMDNSVDTKILARMSIKLL